MYPTAGTPSSAVNVQRLARITGALYLAIAVLGMFGPFALQSLVVSGDAGATVDRIASSPWLYGGSLIAWIALVIVDATVAITLYVLLAPAGRTLSLIAATIRIVYAAALASLVFGIYEAAAVLTRGHVDAAQQAVAMSKLEQFGSSFLLTLVIFGAHLLVLGVLLYRSRYVPRALGALVVAAGIGYISDSLAKFLVADYDGAVRAVALAPALVGELGLSFWLLARGIRENTPAARHADAEPRSGRADVHASAGVH